MSKRNSIARRLVPVVSNNVFVVVRRIMSNHGPSAVARRKIEVHDRCRSAVGLRFDSSLVRDAKNSKVIWPWNSAIGMSLDGVKEAARRLMGDTTKVRIPSGIATQ